MINETKKQIAEHLSKYVDNIGSQNKASKILNGISVATINNILNSKWDNITDDMWRKIGKQVGFNNDGWSSVETKNWLLLNNLFTDARAYSNVFGVCGDAGSGKTHFARSYSQQENVYLVSCNEYFNRKTFLAELLQAMGKDSGGYTVSEMMNTIITQILRAESPLIILDEADKLSDQVLYFFISLYNKLEDKCGIIMMATDHLEKRIERGLRLNKKGYKEIYSRLGRKFIHLPKVQKKDIAQIIKANGLAEDLTITSIFNESEGDLRRVKRLVHRQKLQEA